VSRYKLNPIIIAPPNKGFLIQTPTGTTLFDTRPRGIVRELNRLNDRIARMESFINRFLDPEDLGYVVNNYVRDDAREALGRERVESKP